MKTEIELLARAVCIQDGKLLVCHTRGADNTYLPGGHVEHGESAPASLAREIREEMGLKARVGAFLGVVEHSFRQKGRCIHEVNLVFAISIPRLKPGVAPVSREGHLDFKWLPLAALRSSDLEPQPLRALLRRRGAMRDPLWASTL